MLSSNATEATVDFFMGAVQTRSPKVNPKIIMSDRDWAQINPAQRRWPLALVLLCWWHVLHAWHQHLQIYEHPVLWGLLKGWIRITEEDEFNECWAKIQALAPQKFTQYIQEYWWKHRAMWSATARQDRTVYMMGDTNMLVEAYVFNFVIVNLNETLITLF